MRKEEVIQRLAAHRRELVRFGVKSLALSARDEARPTSDLVEFEGGRRLTNTWISNPIQSSCLAAKWTQSHAKPRLRPVVEEEALYVT